MMELWNDDSPSQFILLGTGVVKLRVTGFFLVDHDQDYAITFSES